jgi:hypothetical protein
MKILRTVCLVLLLAVAGLLPACQSTGPASSSQAVPPELLQLAYLHEIVRYLYRWQLDEQEVEKILGRKDFVFWVHPLPVALDAGDHSQFAEILLPELDISVEVKKVNYTIAEIGTVVKSPDFKITRITRGDLPKQPPSGCAIVTVKMQEMRDYLYRTRNQRDYPGATLVEHLREAVREEAAKEGITDTNLPAGEEMMDAAPLSPVANEIWVYWEAGDKLIYVASDIDLANPAVWKYQTLNVRIFDLERQVVISHDEAPGSDFFLTRYQISRVLYNCMVLGQRIIVPPYSPSNPAPGQKK